MNKIAIGAAEVVAATVENGQTIAVGGFGLCGTPSALLEALLDSGATDLHIITNNCGPEDSAMTTLLRARRIRHVTASYIGDNPVFLRQYLDGSICVDLVPQGTLAEKLRNGGAGIPAFYTPTGVGTALADGAIPRRYRTPTEVIEHSGPREVRTILRLSSERFEPRNYEYAGPPLPAENEIRPAQRARKVLQHTTQNKEPAHRSARSREESLLRGPERGRTKDPVSAAPFVRARHLPEDADHPYPHTLVQ